jgi:hypothetical protein
MIKIMLTSDNARIIEELIFFAKYSHSKISRDLNGR